MVLPRGLNAIEKEAIHLPFLYCTSTLTTTPVRRNFLYPLRIRTKPPAYLCRHSTSQAVSSNNGPQNNRIIRDEASHVPKKPRLKPRSLHRKKPSKTNFKQRVPETVLHSTIIPAEQDIFNRLYKGVDQTLVNIDGKPSPPNPRRTSHNKDVSKISSIFNLALKNMEKSSTLAIRSPSKYSRADEDNLQNFDLESERIRGLYAKLRKFRDSEVDLSSPELGQSAVSDLFVAAEQAAQRETGKICQALDYAFAQGKGDLGLWKVCEERIFPLLKLVDASDLQSSPLSVMKKPSKSNEKGQNRYLNPNCARSKTANIEDHATVTNTSYSSSGANNDSSEIHSFDVPPNVPVLPVVSKIFPKTLLHALRILQENFPASPLTTQFIESIKKHGQTSLAMGSSTDLCNEIIDFRWRVYNDLPYIASLLKDMEEIGAVFDSRTLELVNKIREQRQAERAIPKRGGGGSDSRASWWNSDPINTAYRQLIGRTHHDPSWISRIRSQIRNESKYNPQWQALWNQTHK